MTLPKDPEKLVECHKNMSESAKKRALRNGLGEGNKVRIWTPEMREKCRNAKLGKPLSEETRKKMSILRKGKPFSESHKQALREANTGSKNPQYGKHPSEETRKKLSESHLGSHRNEETKKKMSISASGERNGMFGKKLSPEAKLKCGLSLKGKHHSEETKKKISESHKKLVEQSPEIYIERGLKRRGENHPLWRGGISFEPYCPKFNNEFKERVRAFFNYQCLECGTPQNGTKLHVHHVNFNKKSCCDDSIPLFVPLCVSCHGNTQKNREYWKQHFTEMINSYYGGKCYLTREEYTPIMVIAGVG